MARKAKRHAKPKARRISTAPQAEAAGASTKPAKKAARKELKKAARKPSPTPPTTSPPTQPVAPLAASLDATVLDALFRTVLSRKGANPAISHSARLLARGSAKVAQKLGEEAVETVIEATRGNRDAVVTESADLLYHLIVVWVDAGVVPAEVWSELKRREGRSGIAEKAARAVTLAAAPHTRKVW
ncbi:MAG: phosphoribosyl-ATP diphosphatase [Acetobacteraceae bacterium]|nr:phosphoribosyl-ATP diphosphatase [Acetobacteraceae bacterium]